MRHYDFFVDLRKNRNSLIIMDKLTQQEEEVMLYIWSLEECFVKDIVAKFPEPQPPYTTVASIVNNLKRKGYVEAKRYGNTYNWKSIPPPKLTMSSMIPVESWEE